MTATANGNDNMENGNGNIRNGDPSPCFALRNLPLPQGARERHYHGKVENGILNTPSGGARHPFSTKRGITATATTNGNGK
jgi:hypothetical protein